MVTSSVTSFEPQVRKHGAKVAAAISALWIAGGVVVALWLNALRSGFVVVLAYVVVGAIAALPVSTWLGWRLAPLAVRSRKAFLRMTLWTVVLTDIELAVVAGFALAVITHSFGALLLAPLAVVMGLLIYGLPGLAIAIPSAWWWEHVLRSTFTSAEIEITES
jgi:hypothetical protein